MGAKLDGQIPSHERAKTLLQMRGTDLETLRQYLLALDLDAGQKMIDEMGETHSSAHILMHWVMPVGRQYFDGSFTW